jgi:hypothetical protein
MRSVPPSLPVGLQPFLPKFVLAPEIRNRKKSNLAEVGRPLRTAWTGRATEGKSKPDRDPHDWRPLWAESAGVFGAGCFDLGAVRFVLGAAPGSPASRLRVPPSDTQWLPPW